MTYIPLGKFDSARDETLFYLAMDWMEDSFGDMDYGLWVTAISVSADDLDNEQLIFQAKSTDLDMPLTELVGHFIITENSQGFVYATKYEDEESRNAEVDKLREAWEAWASQDEDDEGHIRDYPLTD